MRQSRTSGSVGDPGGNLRVDPTSLFTVRESRSLILGADEALWEGAATATLTQLEAAHEEGDADARGDGL
jgi:hypothetical protein